MTGPASAPAPRHGPGGSPHRARRPAPLPRHGTGRPRPHPARAARPGRIVLAGVLTAALAAAAFAALTLAAPAAGPARAALTAYSAAGAPAAHPSPSPAASPGPSPSPAAPAAGTSSAGCGFLDVSCEIGNAVTSWFAALARDALKPLLTLAGQTLLSSPQAGAIPAVHSMWTTSLAIADSAYVLLAVIGGVIVMGHETLQTSYSAKDIAPRLVTGFLTANLSLVLISAGDHRRQRPVRRPRRQRRHPRHRRRGPAGHPDRAAVRRRDLPGPARPGRGRARPGAGSGLRPAADGAGAADRRRAARPGRYALPQTAWAARWWWRALTADLAIQVAQALVLTAAVRVFSSAGWIPLNGTSSSLLPVLTAICLLYIMMRIPWWISRPVLASFGPSPIRRAARFAFYAAVLSRVSPLLHGAAAGKRPPSSAGGQGRKPAGPRGGGPARRRTWRRPTRGRTWPPGRRGQPAAGRGRTWRRPRRDRGPAPRHARSGRCRAEAPVIRSRPPAGRPRARPCRGRDRPGRDHAPAGSGRGGPRRKQARAGASRAGLAAAAGHAAAPPHAPARPARPALRGDPYAAQRGTRPPAGPGAAAAASPPAPRPAAAAGHARPCPPAPPAPAAPWTAARPPSPGSGQPAPAPPGTCLPRCRASRKVITGELRPARQHPDPR